MKYLVVGLGNIGAEYAETRHNIGFKVLDALAEASDISFMSGRYGSTAELRWRGRSVTLLKPSTYMNLSGKAVRYWLDTLKIDRSNLLVVVDDIALPFGELRIRPKGSAGGHNGIKSIIALLGSDEFPRIKIGVGAKPNPAYDLADWVLSKFQEAEWQEMERAFAHAADAATLIVQDQMDRAMNLYSK